MMTTATPLGRFVRDAHTLDEITRLERTQPGFTAGIYDVRIEVGRVPGAGVELMFGAALDDHPVGHEFLAVLYAGDAEAGVMTLRKLVNLGGRSLYAAASLHPAGYRDPARQVLWSEPSRLRLS